MVYSQEKKQYQVYIEREVLMKMSHPNLIKLFFSFQDKYKLYFVLEYCEGGEFSDFLKINSISILYSVYGVFLFNIYIIYSSISFHFSKVCR